MSQPTPPYVGKGAEWVGGRTQQRPWVSPVDQCPLCWNTPIPNRIKGFLRGLNLV